MMKIQEFLPRLQVSSLNLVTIQLCCSSENTRLSVSLQVILDN